MAADPNRPTLFARFSGVFLRFLARSLARVRFEGLDHVPQTGPLLIVSNHASNADGLLLIGFVVPAAGRPVLWLGKEEALRWPVLGWVIAQNGVFGIRRGAGDLDAFRAARRVLDDGHVLAIFPEGTRSPTGALQAAKEGATVLALRSGAPILPIGIEGSQRFWPKGTRIPRLGARMTVRIGEPFTLQTPAGGTRHDQLRAATDELMGRVAALLPSEQRGVYAGVARPSDT